MTSFTSLPPEIITKISIALAVTTTSDTLPSSSSSSSTDPAEESLDPFIVGTSLKALLRLSATCRTLRGWIRPNVEIWRAHWTVWFDPPEDSLLPIATPLGHQTSSPAPPTPYETLLRQRMLVLRLPQVYAAHHSAWTQLAPNVKLEISKTFVRVLAQMVREDVSVNMDQRLFKSPSMRKMMMDCLPQDLDPETNMCMMSEDELFVLTAMALSRDEEVLNEMKGCTVITRLVNEAVFPWGQLSLDNVNSLFSTDLRDGTNTPEFVFAVRKIQIACLLRLPFALYSVDKPTRGHVVWALMDKTMVTGPRNWKAAVAGRLEVRRVGWEEDHGFVEGMKHLENLMLDYKKSLREPTDTPVQNDSLSTFFRNLTSLASSATNNRTPQEVPLSTLFDNGQVIRWLEASLPPQTTPPHPRSTPLPTLQPTSKTLSIAQASHLQQTHPFTYLLQCSIQGTWVGFYASPCLILPNVERITDGPMLLTLSWHPETLGLLQAGFELERTGGTEKKDVPALLKFEGRGQDDVEPFSIEGSMSSRTGKVFLRKQYNTFGWNYEGAMLEGGICGKWGGEYDGVFCIWKVGL
ncbi:hypothetical protein HDV05_002615 [Chytridiales sp. JEL 0842]|nr:hypothetical protein HDV05_002615 [Chytridiales sp. JEL 0842]